MEGKNRKRFEFMVAMKFCDVPEIRMVCGLPRKH
jgi:hypothetical protein